MLLYQSPKLYMDCSVQCRVQATQIRGLLGKGKQMALTVTAQVWALGMLQQCRFLEKYANTFIGMLHSQLEQNLEKHYPIPSDPRVWGGLSGPP